MEVSTLDQMLLEFPMSFLNMERSRSSELQKRLFKDTFIYGKVTLIYILILLDVYSVLEKCGLMEWEIPERSCWHENFWLSKVQPIFGFFCKSSKNLYRQKYSGLGTPILIQ